MIERSSCIVFYLNGSRREIENPDPDMTLLEYVRKVEGLTGSKLGCGEGGCGACTVMVSSYDAKTERLDHRSVNGCLFPLVMADNFAVTTVEGVGDRKGGLHPVQIRLARQHGSQCGFCTPGIVMSMYTLLRQKSADGEDLTERDVEENFDGNLCRCTGYRPILDAYKSFATPSSNGGCCGGGGVDGGCPCKEGKEEIEKRFSEGTSEMRGRVETNGHAKDRVEPEPVVKEPLFPEELVQRVIPSLLIVSETCRWYRPTSLKELIELKAEFPSAKLISGNTEVGVERKFKGLKPGVVIAVNAVSELALTRETEVGFEIGAGTTLTELVKAIDSCIATRRGKGCGNLIAIKEQIRWFAGKQIRNVAAVGGNVVTASPISDLNPLWVASKADFVLISTKNNEKRVSPADGFFQGYRRVDMKPDELLLNVVVPWSREYEVMSALKLSRRKDDDISIVCAGIRLYVQWSPSTSSWNIAEASFCFGGVAAKTVSASSTEKSVVGLELNEETMQKAMMLVGDEMRVASDAPGGMAEFRSSLVVGFVFKAFVKTVEAVSQEAKVDGVTAPAWIPEDDVIKSTIPSEKPLLKGVQIYDRVCDKGLCSVGKPISHVSAELQTSGEAIYVDDIPMPPRGLYSSLVLSTKAHAKIISVNCEKALSLKGVVDVVLAKDIRGENLLGPVVKDTPCFAEDEVTCVGQVIGLVVAESETMAKEAAKAVVVTYEELPAVITIEDAIREGSFLKNFTEHRIVSGDVDKVFADETVLRVSGEFRIGAQEHFYLETNGSLCVPTENDEMTVYSSIQSAAHTQVDVSTVLGVPQNKIVVKVKRLGGGFGGKESRPTPFTAAIAVAAQKHNRPVRIFLDRDVDMATTGQRHSFYAKYTAAFKEDGEILAIDVMLYNNAGNTYDLSLPVLDRALFHIENSYKIPNVRCRGWACYTNTSSNTAFRGFGGPQGMFVMENIVDHVASTLGLRPEKVRHRNLFMEGDVTPYGMKLEGCTVRQCWDQVMQSSQIEDRLKSVEVFNAEHRHRKRGIAAVPTMFGISFTFRTLNQAGALVHVYTDGSVLISHGGVEMGQGLHTKMIQVAATELCVPLEKVFVSESATDKVPNSSPTAASASADMYGKAVQDACAQISKRLVDIKERLGPDSTWESVVGEAYANRVNLSAQGFYAVPDLNVVNLGENGKGSPFYYFTYGSSVSEVEIDCLTGEVEVLRTDIVMDVGRSLNPAIDVGQIEGAFVQGLGWCTMEEVVRGGKTAHAWLPAGVMFTQGPSTYKIPGFQDIPKDFRVALLKDTPNHRSTIHQSKAVGEPPLFLAASVFFAIQDACCAARRSIEISEDEHQRPSFFQMDSPATAERIRMACTDQITNRFTDSDYRPAIFF